MAEQQDICGSLELVTSPLGRIVSLSEAKTHCRVEQGETIDDPFITDLIDHSQEFTETLISGHRQWLPAVYDLPLRDWPWCEGVLRLPRPPLLSVLSLGYYDTADASQTLATSVYRVRTPWRQPGSIELIYGQTWPYPSVYREFPITVRFLAGYARAFTANATTDTITLSGKALPNGTLVRLVSTTTLPAGLDSYTDYFVVSTSANTFKLALVAGGSAVDITDVGTGTHYVALPPLPVKRAVLMLVAHGYRHREPILAGSISKELEFSVTSLLESQAFGSYA